MMYGGSGNRSRGGKHGRGGQRSTWNESPGALNTAVHYHQRRNDNLQTFPRKAPLLDAPDHVYGDRRKKPPVNGPGSSRFNWKRIGYSTNHPYDFDYLPADDRPQDQLEDDESGDHQVTPIFYGQEERGQSSSSIVSDDFGHETRITSEGQWSDDYHGGVLERSQSGREVETEERLEKMKKELSDYARDERIYKLQLKEYRAKNHELLQFRSEQAKAVKKLKAELANSARRKMADNLKIAELTKQLEAKNNGAACRNVEQSKRIAQLEAELLAVTKQAEFNRKAALDQHLNRLKEQLATSSYLPDNMAVLQAQHDKLRAYTSQLEAKVADLKSKVDSAKTEKHSEELKRKECEKKFRKEIDAVHAFNGGSVVEKLKLGASAVRLLKVDVDQLRQIARATATQCSIEFHSVRINLQQKIAAFAAHRSSLMTVNGQVEVPRDPRKRRMY